MNKITELNEFLQNLADKETKWENDGRFSAYEHYGGQCDDAFSGGIDDGEIYLAREILKKFFNDEN